MADIVETARTRASSYRMGGPSSEHTAALLDELADTIIALRAEVEQHQRSFDLRWDASMRAIARWQEAHPGNDLNWPDHADLVVWLLERDAALRAENENLVKGAVEQAAACGRLLRDLHAVQAENERLRAALEEIASGKYSGIVLTSYPPQDPAVNRARAALEASDD